MDKEYQHIVRGFGPVFDSNSKILILGSFPSVKSREINFYYGHPQNRFWPLVSGLLGTKVPDSIDGKRQFLLENGIALWDSIEECDICGSSDSSIKNAIPVDIMKVLNTANITGIFANGAASAKVYNKYLKSITGIDIVTLPSTSPANAAWNLERLMDEWKRILDYLPKGVNHTPFESNP